MIVAAHIVDGPVTAEVEAEVSRRASDQALTVVDGGGVGATLRFEGIVRREEEGSELDALEYKTYDPMAERELEALAHNVATTHRLSSLIVLHSRGRVGVGEVSFVLRVAAPHRAEAIAAVDEFISRMKQDVPIWKTPVWVHTIGAKEA